MENLPFSQNTPPPTGQSNTLGIIKTAVAGPAISARSPPTAIVMMKIRGVQWELLGSLEIIPPQNSVDQKKLK